MRKLIIAAILLTSTSAFAQVDLLEQQRLQIQQDIQTHAMQEQAEAIDRMSRVATPMPTQPMKHPVFIN